MTVATVATAAPEPASALRVTAHAIPDTEPPYDDGAGDPPAPDPRPGLLPCPPPPEPEPATLRVVPLPDEPEDTFEPVRTPRPELEDPLPRAAMLARSVLEVLSGVRPAAQLARWLSPEVHAALEAMVANRPPRPYAIALRRVLVGEPMPGVAEVTAVVDRGPRVEALALRLEGLDGRWLVTALQRA